MMLPQACYSTVKCIPQHQTPSFWHFALPRPSTNAYKRCANGLKHGEGDEAGIFLAAMRAPQPSHGSGVWRLRLARSFAAADSSQTLNEQRQRLHVSRASAPSSLNSCLILRKCPSCARGRGGSRIGPRNQQCSALINEGEITRILGRKNARQESI